MSSVKVSVKLIPALCARIFLLSERMPLRPIYHILICISCPPPREELREIEGNAGKARADAARTSLSD